MTLTTARKTIGKYQILAKLGESSMNKVYKAFDPDRNTTVAIKVLASHLVRDNVLRQRFEQEYRATSKLSHPHIVQVLEFGWEGAAPYFVMELVDGEDLWSRIERQGRLPEAEAVAIIMQVAEGLHEAHKHGILHRDIKPDNILLTKDGQAKLTDLGLSKDLDEDLELTRPNKGLGTPNFIAVEQFGDAMNATIRCDIYSLGATLYMALTGQLPFAGANLTAIMTMKLNNDLVSPRKLVPNLSEHLEWAIRRATQADPGRRFATCPEFIAALKGETSAHGISAPKTGKRAQRPGKERRGARRYDCALPTCCVINLSVHADETDSQTSYQAQVCSLSTDGIGLYLPRRFEPDTILTATLTSRSGAAQETRKLRVVRVAPVDRKGWFVGGVLLQELSKEELRSLL
jgi:serine/threonine protein kinase